MADSKNSDGKGFFILFLLAVMGLSIWFIPLAVIFALPACWFIRNQTISKILYVLAIVIIALYFVGYAPAQQFLLGILKTHYRFFSISAFKNGNGFQTMLYYFQHASLEGIMLYFVFGAVLVAIVIFSLWRFVCWFFIRKDGSRRLLKARKDARPDFRKYQKDLGALSQRGVPLGVMINLDGKAPVLVPHKMLNKHVCLVGTTGSGKTNTLYLFIINALYNRKPVIYIDGKGDFSNIGRFKRFAKNAEVVTMDGQTGYNPFSSGTPTELTDKIISMFDWSEEHYKLGAARFIQLLLRYFELCKIDKNLVNIIKYCDLKAVKNHYVSQNTGAIGAGGPAPGLNNLVPDPNGAAFSLANIGKNAVGDNLTPATGILSAEADEILSAFENIDSKAISGIQSRLASLAEGDLRGLFTNKYSVDLNKIIENGQSVLFSLDSLRYPEQSRALGRLIVNDLKACVSAHQRRGGGAVGVFIDEFNVFASHEIVDVINKSRSAGFEAVLSFQSLSDIDKLDSGEALRRQIIQNCNTLICQLQNDSYDAEELSGLFGTFESVQETLQVDEHGDTTGVGSLRKVREFLVHPDDIKRLGVGQAFIKIANMGMAKIQIANLD